MAPNQADRALCSIKLLLGMLAQTVPQQKRRVGIDTACHFNCHLNKAAKL